MAYLCLWEGAWEEAVAHAEQALRQVERARNHPSRYYVHQFLAEHALLAGHAAAARDYLLPLLDHLAAQSQYLGRVLPRLAWAYLDLGEVARADALIRQASALARADKARLALVTVLWVQAMVATRQEAWAEAAGALGEGLTLARDLPYPHAEARLLHQDGVLHRAQGEVERARARFAAALDIVERLGARREVARMQQELTALRAQRLTPRVPSARSGPTCQ